MQKVYRKVGHIFEGILENIYCSQKIIKKPKYEYYNGDKILILLQDLLTMKDGIELEICYWSESDLCLLDVSVDSKKYKEKLGKLNFEDYLKGNGFYIENVEDSKGLRWHYYGTIWSDDYYRVQYCLEDDN